MAVGGCSARAGGWSIRPYTVSANACHLRGILSGLTMLGDIQDVYLGDVHGVYPQDGADVGPAYRQLRATVPTRHMPQAVANIADSLAIGMDAGILVIR